MAEPIEDSDGAGSETPRPRRMIVRRIFGALLLLLVGVGIYGWANRGEIAADLITGQLRKLGLEASYKVVSIGPRRQVIADIVVGDPAHPDLTIERAELSIVPRFPLVGVGRLELVKPRLYGNYLKGKLSFGALDPLIFKQPKQAFEFPDMELVLDDARALLESDYGAIGLKAEGRGNLQGGFAGIFAANAPQVVFNGCQAARATLYGKVTIDAERPEFDGPLRLGELTCAGRQLSLNRAAMQLQVRLDRGLDGAEGKAGLTGGELRLAGNKVDAIKGSTDFSWRNNALTAEYKLAVSGIDTPQVALASLAIDGSARSRDGLGRIEVQAGVQGGGLRPGVRLDQRLRDAAASVPGTLAGPMLGQIRQALAQEGRGSRLAADVTLRKTGEVLSMVAPQARLRGRSGQTLLALSRFQAAWDGNGLPRFTGNFSTGGRGLPRIAGRMENRGEGSASVLRMKMAEYKAGDNSLELPDLLVSQARGGSIAISGHMLASGAIPGGSARALKLPLDGGWSAKEGFSLWRECTEAGFDKLELSSLSLDKGSVEFCPSGGGAILRDDKAGLKIAAAIPSLGLAGKLGQSPVVLRSGPVKLAYPGMLEAKDADIALGAKGAQSHFHLATLTSRIGGTFGGAFTGTGAELAAVPLDLFGAHGEWHYANGKLDVSGASFGLKDREKLPRFAPLAARGATLELKDGRIAASTLLREPRTDRAIVRADIVHDLDSGTGHADLTVDGVTFDSKLQPDTLSDLALGLVANSRGTVTGNGRINWTADMVTSSGEFSTKKLDFAAAFGPVEGVSGTIRFTDLLGLVTAPDQHIDIASFNPGVEVDAGRLSFEIHKDYELAILGGRWPFLGGSLVLEPTTTRMTVAEPRHYTLKMEGIDAARFVQTMDLANFSASGKFDGRLPLVFDENGGRIEQGYLVSRPPGGNLSYVGALTYEDMGKIANYAFQSLKSLDFNKMEIDLDGPLTGEIVTKVRFDGIRQGAAASKNIVTRQIAKLPIKFNINIRAPFYRLITSFKMIYDPAYIKDPRDLGLVDQNGRAIPRVPPPPAAKPKDLPADEANIQHPASEKQP